MSVLIIPIDASKIADADRKQQRVKVAVQQRDSVKSQIVAVDGGKAELKFDVEPKLPISIAVGPETASDQDIFNLQTLTATVSPAQWTDSKSLTTAVLVITPNWWIGWLRWCREFVITGRVVCPDGSPVPGAEVTAYDVDFFWWWSSAVQIGGSVVTDASGHFTMKFRWCCGWWPWYWWQLRQWRLDFDLVSKLKPVVDLNPRLKFPAPDPVPSLDFAALNPQPLPPVIGRPGLAIGKTIDPTVLPGLRDKLISVLPQVPEFERLRIWPWFPWAPWFDCDPDIIFKVTQKCGTGPVKVIHSENIFQTRWNVPTNLSVTLLANSDACCVPPPPPPPPGDCMLLSSVCGDPGFQINHIGGNFGAVAPAPAGYFDPGGSDRPFADAVSIYGLFGSSAQADYYEIEFKPHAAAVWATVPQGALLDLNRQYHDATVPFPGNPWFGVTFPPTPLALAGGYYESRTHYENRTPPANWNNVLSGRAWTTNYSLVASIETAGFFSDGTYDFRVIGYKTLPGGGPDLATRKVLDPCGQGQNTNFLTLQIDNRVPPNPGFTPGTVHVATTEPDCGITNVLLGGAALAPCGAKQLTPGTALDIDFFATDPDGHLDHYTFEVKWDLGSVKSLLDPVQVGALTLTTTAGHQTGPDYATALTQGAARPTWTGGAMHLHIADASKVFPKTCCYLLELTVYKRNIVACGGGPYYNQMHYSFTVTV